MIRYFISSYSLSNIIKWTFLLFFCLVSLRCSLAEDESAITVHIIPHSHTDLGWKHTIEEYFIGRTEFGCVKCIYDSALQSLPESPDYKFTIEQVGFLIRWWEHLSTEQQSQFAKLVEKGQIEFLNGGIAMSDTACPHYEHIIDQYALGQQWLKEKFNYYPKIGWALDQFGHSKTHAWILAKMGYDAQILERVHENARGKRQSNKQMGFIWQPDEMFEEKLYTQLTDYNYWDDPNFKSWQTCYHGSCDNGLTDTQYDNYKYWNEKRSKYYTSKHVEHHIGGDFSFSNGITITFIRLERIIKQINKMKDSFKAQFSTYGEFFKALNGEISAKSKELEHFTDDFFPLISSSDQPWTGFYTSKPVLKGLAFDGIRYLLAAKTLYSKILLKDLTNFKLNKNNTEEAWNKLWDFDEALGVLTHHDAITGTAKAYVDEVDYYGKIFEAHGHLNEAISKRVKNYMYQQGVTPSGMLEFVSCGLDNAKENCFAKHSKIQKEGSTFLTVFNPGNARDLYIKVSVSHPQIVVINESDQFVESDVFCLNETKGADCTLYFRDHFNAFELKGFVILPTQVSDEVEPSEGELHAREFRFGEKARLFFHSYKHFEMEVCSHSLAKKKSCLSENITLEYMYYTGKESTEKKSGSGAYLFNPEEQDPKLYGKFTKAKVFEGDFLTIIQVIRDLVETRIVIYHDDLYHGIEIQTHLYPIPMDDNKGKEIILSVDTTGINNQAVVVDSASKILFFDKTLQTHAFFTDANGLFTVERFYGYKEGYQLSSWGSDEIQYNYYPVTSAIGIEDKKTGNKRITLMNDRSQGGTSRRIGQVELMIHRVCTTDDKLNLEEVLKDVDPATGAVREVDLTHYLILSKDENAQRRRQYMIDNKPLIFYGKIPAFSSFYPAKQKKKEDVAMLPLNLKVNVRPQKGGALMVRFHNINPEIPLKIGLFDVLSILAKREIVPSMFSRIVETTISGHRPFAEAQNERLRWEKNQSFKKLEDFDDFNNIELSPLDIRAFMLYL